jgi:hypothetical protein
MRKASGYRFTYAFAASSYECYFSVELQIHLEVPV